MKPIGSPQIGQSGGGPLSMIGSSGSSKSSSSAIPMTSLLSGFHFQLQCLFRTLTTGHADEGQPAVDDRRRDGSNGMAIGQILPVLRRNIDFTIGKAVFHTQLLPQTLGRRTGAATRRYEQRDVGHERSGGLD